MTDYVAFLDRKRRVNPSVGIEPPVLPPVLYDWQQALVRWALRKGRAAIFADCGLGKTFMQLAWASALGERTLILAPLCVAEQTVGEAARLGLAAHYARDEDEAGQHRIVVTNYERLEKFSPDRYGAVVLDESSILKAFDGATRTALIRAFANTKYRLCCTATPSPNDISELGNHAEFLGLMTRAEFLATWFVKVDRGLRTVEHHGWKMKGHAVTPFYRWLASWAMALRSPADIGYDATGYDLPPLSILERIVEADAPVGYLFPGMAVKGIQGRNTARRASLTERVEATAELTRGGEQWLVWCGLNAESAALARAIPNAIEVQGSDTYAEKVGAVQAFVSGRTRVLVTKAKILGFGMNFQHCARMAFVGMSDSYEAYYQCLRRCWRYGQRSPVEAYVVVSDAERVVVENVRRKEQHSANLSAKLLAHVRDFERAEVAA